MALDLIKPGAFVQNEGVLFNVWAPLAQSVNIVLPNQNKRITMTPGKYGFFSKTLPSIGAGTRYLYEIDGKTARPDPASSYQPEGVHQASEVIDHSFEWHDVTWTPPALKDSVFYQLHVGTFTQEGTFDAIIPYLPYLKDLGITTLQLMPVAQFPGNRNWGYDGVFLYAPHNSYGGPKGLKRLVQACHSQGLAIYLDVVYNHLGPEGNYLWDYGPYFTEKYRSPWGASVNLDGPYSDAVRNFFIQNALYWFEWYHIDGLRLDATHALFDFSARPFLAELSTAVNAWAKDKERTVYLIAENDQSDHMLTRPVEDAGKGMNGQWLDDLHHTLHVALTGENDGYYADYQEESLLVKVLKEGFAYSGQYSPSRKRRHGTYSGYLPTDRFIVSTQTHDQVGNRMLGERLSQLTGFDGLKLAACLLACSPYVPMLFMGEEYGETAPFLYFISHSDEHLIESVRQGRLEEFKAFSWAGTPPDPQAVSTYLDCKLDHSLRDSSHHAILWKVYKELFRFRASHDAMREPDRTYQEVYSRGTLICLERHSEAHSIRIFMNFGKLTGSIERDDLSQKWETAIDSNSPSWCQQLNPLPPKPTITHANNRLSITLPPLSFLILKSTSS